MRKTFGRSVSVSMLLMFLAMILWTCGGGGGGTGGTQTQYQIPYSGISSEALITENNGSRIVEGAYFGTNEPMESIPSLHAVTDDPASIRPEKGIARVLPNSIMDALRKSGAFPHSLSPFPRASATDQWNETGPCGGTASYIVTGDDVTGDFHGTVTFATFSDCDYVMSGSTDISGRYQVSTGGILRLGLEIGVITISSGDESISISGSMDLDWQVYPSTTTLNLRTRDDGTGEVFWFENYVMSGRMSDPSAEMTISGRYYDPAYGYVTLTTDAVFRNFALMVYPMEGTLRAAGAKGTSSRLVAVDEVLYRVEIDTDGDGNVDTISPAKHWPGANREPAVAITGDTRGNVDCIASLDGSGSYDRDGDTLNFRWRILSAPGGSTAALVDASGPKATFLPDLRGEYSFELTVSDGYVEAVSTYGPVTVGGGLFCSENGSGLVAVGSTARAVAVSDVNGDGRNDVVFVTDYYDSPDNDGKLFVLLQDASGGLSVPIRYDLSGSYSSRPFSIAAGDVNGDGRNDVVVALTGSGIEVFLQDSGGALQPARFIETPDSSYVRIADLNNDGRMDLAAIGWGTNTVTVWIQDATGSLGTPSTFNVEHGGWDDLELGDVSGDGRADVIVMSGQGLYDTFGVLTQTLDGSLNVPAYYNSGTGVLPSSLAIGDVNFDGKEDVVLGQSGGIVLFHQSASGTFDPPLFYPLLSGGSGDVVVGDLNRDGRNDVIGGYGGAGLGIFFQRLDGTLAPYDLYLTPNYSIWALAIGDINGDGLADVVAGTAEGIVILRNTGRF